MIAIYWLMGVIAFAFLLVITIALAFNPDGSKGGD